MSKPIISTAAEALLSTGSAVMARLKTMSARGSAQLGERTRLGSEGRVFNIGRNRSDIRVGRDGMLRGELLTFAHGGAISIGDWFYLGPGSTIWSSSPGGVTIGDRVLISHGVHIHDTDSHPLDPSQRFEQVRSIMTVGHPRDIAAVRSAPVCIGNDVWIGMGALIMKGVTIGDRAIIGARSIVRSDVATGGLVQPGALHDQRKRE